MQALPVAQTEEKKEEVWIMTMKSFWRGTANKSIFFLFQESVQCFVDEFQHV